MFSFKDKIAEYLRIFFEERGIDPLYAATVLIILITLSYWRYFKNWNKTPASTKRLSIATVFAAIVMIIFCILKLIGVGKL